ncbi:RcnB family protein [Asticcacaulis sp. EMRT-3]|uniref:RcnB family protein n=1 Tax=Asticcacaulis sp. EMRT-3 TaxID=3040349 RepID=UPI0024AF41ED|nr:RcnB family protein [Asticcacaulis sp. EMRT-3]MDI7774014.1 RcnB family protein [Asticcacaulis sp. EMRT-3]
MKRILTTAAICVLAGSLAIGTAAEAAPYSSGHDRGHSERGYDRDHNDRGGHDRGHNDRGYDRGGHDRGGHDRGHHYVRHYDHSGWRRGGYMPRDYWNHGYRVDYHRYHLSRPPRGYEWRYVDGDYVLAGITSGLIASIILGN